MNDHRIASTPHAVARRHRRTRHAGAWLLALATLAGSAAAQQQKAPPAPAATPAASPADTTIVEGHRQITLNGRVLRYTSRAGVLPMKDEDGKLRASIFFVAYTLDGVADAAHRPITFAYNGGPGSSSVWLHMGALGPRRVLLSDEGDALPAPYRLVDNTDTWLDFTDLVFIDPVLTGYSRPAAGQDKSQFTGIEEDIASVGDFIRLYTTRYQRWPSPKFLAGESYGTFRSAGVGNYLQQRHGMYVTGITLISSVLDLKTLEFAVGHDLPYALYLPSYTAVAWYHKKLPAELQSAGLEAAVQQARAFAMGDYNHALMMGSRLPAAERQRIRAQLARFTGLSESFLEESDLRVTDTHFFKELERADGHTIGRLDARFLGRDRDMAGEGPEYDPSYAAIQGPFSAVLNNYVRDELGYHNDLTYELLGGRVQPWNWGGDSAGYTNLNSINVAERLRAAMTQNPHLHVLVANGWFDMATPFGATEYTFAHLGGDPKLLDRVRLTYYPAGHMMYIEKSARQQLTTDVRAFYSWALGEAAAPASSRD